MKITRLLLALAVVFPTVGISSVRGADKDPLSLDDLGFKSDDLKADSAQQTLLHKRSRMLKTHQILGLVTAIPMAATLMTSSGASDGTSSKRALHRDLGITTGALYFTTAGFSIMAPEVEGKKSSGVTRVHKGLAFIHFPAMVIAPILGSMAYKQKQKGESVHGVASHHAAVASIGAGAYFLSMAIMVFNF